MPDEGEGGGKPMQADDIPVAHTPPGGYGDTMPPPILAGCGEPMVAGAPDLAGIWRVVSVIHEGADVPDHPTLSSIQRVEQHGVHDVFEGDFTTQIIVVASYEDGVHVLRPVGLPGIEVTRRIEDEHMIWTYFGFEATLERITG